MKHWTSKIKDISTLKKILIDIEKKMYSYKAKSEFLEQKLQEVNRIQSLEEEMDQMISQDYT